jgi:hypothetical protein
MGKTTIADSFVNTIARMCHEVNRSWCILNHDYSQPVWEDAPDWQKNSAIDGVKFHLANPDAKASASHDNWMKDKLEAGWEWGEIKDPNSKPPTHPCIVPFEDLPNVQQIKDKLFRATVHAIVYPEPFEPKQPDNVVAIATASKSKTSVTDVGFNPSNNNEIHEIKTKVNELAAIIGELPPGRRRSIALTELEGASMWAVKAAAVGDA